MIENKKKPNPIDIHVGIAFVVRRTMLWNEPGKAW